MSDDVSTARRALACLDLTELGDACRPTDVNALCDRAVTPRGAVAAVCVWPQFVPLAKARLAPTPVRVATVINFPKGGEGLLRPVEDAKEALNDGADEIDLVMPYRAFLRGDADVAREVIAAVAETTQGKLLKVILETGALRDASDIAGASRLAIDAGADFLKTSTGKIAISATPEAAAVMLAEIKAAPRPVGFKAAGGVRTLADAKTYLDLADSVMGEAWAKPSTFRIGASGLLDALLAALGGAPAPAARQAY